MSSDDINKRFNLKTSEERERFDQAISCFKQLLPPAKMEAVLEKLEEIRNEQ